MFTQLVAACLRKGAVAFCFKDDTATQQVIGGTVFVREFEPVKERKKGWVEKYWAKVSDKLLEYSLVARHLVQGTMPEFFTSPDYKKQSRTLQELQDMIQPKMLSWHLQYGPQEKHWFVEIVGTHPSFRGKGVGGQLMKRVGELADEARMDCYLECSMENLGFYEKFGYQQVSVQVYPLKDPAIRPISLHLMVRRCNTTIDKP